MSSISKEEIAALTRNLDGRGLLIAALRSKLNTTIATADTAAASAAASAATIAELLAGTGLVYVASGATEPVTLGDGLSLSGSSGARTLAASSRYTEPDASTLLQWRLQESAAPYASTGSNTLALTLKRGTVSADFNGLLGAAPYFAGALGSGPSSVEPTNNALTVSFWVKFYTLAACTLLTKYYAAAWSSPFASLYFAMNSGAAWIGGVNIAGALRQTTVSGTKFGIKINTWHQLALTYDGAAARYYLDGMLAATDTIAGVIDYGTHGPWDVGGQSTGENGLLDGVIEDVRVESVVRSAAYLRAMYRAAMRL